MCGYCNSNEFCGSDSKCHSNLSDAGIDTNTDTTDIIEENQDTTFYDIQRDSTDLQDIEDGTHIADSSIDINISDNIDIVDIGNKDTNNSSDIYPIDSSRTDIYKIDIISIDNEDNIHIDNSTGCSCSTMD